MCAQVSVVIINDNHTNLFTFTKIKIFLLQQKTYFILMYIKKKTSRVQTLLLNKDVNQVKLRERESFF